MWREKIKTPKLTVDGIVLYNGKIALIERRYPPLGWALPGGFVDTGETVEDAVRREMSEELNIDLNELKQFHVYSDPARDPRFHTVSVVFTAITDKAPVAGDDAKNVRLFTKDEIMSMIYEGAVVFDHHRILTDYFNSLN
ncbi:MAG: NUDIX hydrolase [Oligoflexia bacterium]|nr:NUDIX hydrolase [Oligoflexia bacterium]